jgi:hypothetical protein
MRWVQLYLYQCSCCQLACEPHVVVESVADEIEVVTAVEAVDLRVVERVSVPSVDVEVAL